MNNRDWQNLPEKFLERVTRTVPEENEEVIDWILKKEKWSSAISIV